MSQIDGGDNILLETEAGHGDIVDGLKLVPVSESIRYRKRAQSAEKMKEVLAEELAEARSKFNDVSGQLEQLKAEQELTRKLAGAGVLDLEAAVLIAKSWLGERGDADLDSVIEQLKSEKEYLFVSVGGKRSVSAKRTAGFKDRLSTGRDSVLERAASKASTTGNRADLQEYLKLRRNFV